ncbi:MAG: hypothetical protein HUU20_15560 [Pirellulales bacterium]|nr:hypothetical protein [Pirellulales bacterium]
MTRKQSVAASVCLWALVCQWPWHVQAQGLVSTQPLATTRPRLDLDGPWSFRLDPSGEGQTREWHTDSAPFAGTIQVPGCWQAQGFGVETSAKKFSSLDDGWYKKTFNVPADWQGKEVWLNLGGVKPAADVWLNGKHIGFTRSSRTPLKADVTDCVRFGAANTLCIRVAWPNVRLDGVWDWEDCIWGGLYRSVYLEATESTWIDEAWVRGDAADRRARVELAVRSPKQKGKAFRVRCRISAVEGPGGPYVKEQEVPFAADEAARVSFDLKIEDARLWSPDEPSLYRAEIALLSEANAVDQVSVRFGFREIATRGTQILLNNRPIFLRGGCDDQFYPATICPPASKEFFARRLRLAKQYGFNYTKSCIEVFTPEFLDAADEVGMLVCQEMPFGLSGEFRSVRRDPPSEFESLYRAELGNIIAADRNHPSVTIYSVTSELELTEHSFRLFGRELPEMAKRLNPSALVIDVTAGFGFSRQTQYGTRVTDILEDCGLGLEPLRERPAFDAALEAPYLAHEYQWWTSLPNPETKPKYDGLPMKPFGVDELETAAAASGLAGELPELVANSRKLKYLLRKEGLEFARTLRSCAGYHHWLIHDFNFCPEGVFDEFWQPPADLTAEEFRTYNADTVLLLDDHRQRCFAFGDGLSLPVLVSHYGPKPIEAAELAWVLKHGERTLLSGAADVSAVPCGTLHQVAEVHGAVPQLDGASELVIEARLRDATGSTINRNQWKIWAFPRTRCDLRGKGVKTNLPDIQAAYPGAALLDKAAPPSDAALFVTDTFSEEAVHYVESGGRVLLLSTGDLPEVRGPHCNLFRTVPYNTGSTGTMGTRIADAPALARFPHNGWCDLQFLHLISGVWPLDLDALKPAKIDPLVRSIGHYKTMRNQAYLFEAAIGRGAIMATTFDIARTLPARPETQFLLDELLRYCLSDRFKPPSELGAKFFLDRIEAKRRRGTARSWELNSGVTAGYEPDKAHDGDSNTFWASNAPDRKTPKDMGVEWPKPRAIAGVRIEYYNSQYVPAMDGQDLQVWDGNQWRSIDDEISISGEAGTVWLHRFAPLTTARIRVLVTKMGPTPYPDYERPAVREFDVLGSPE